MDQLSESSSLLKNIQSALEPIRYETPLTSTKEETMSSSPTMTRQISLPDVRRRSRLLQELRHEPVSGNSMFRNPDLLSTPSAPSSDAGHANDSLDPTVLATIREAIADNKPTYKWRGVSYAVPADMLSNWHQANARVAASPPRPASHMSTQVVKSVRTQVIDLISDTSDSETDHPAKSVRVIPGTQKERSARCTSAGDKSQSHGVLHTTATEVFITTHDHEQSNEEDNAGSRDSNTDPQRNRAVPSHPLEMDEALSAITLEIRYRQRPKISLRECYTARALFERVRARTPRHIIIANDTIKALTVYLPDDREVGIHEGNQLEFQALVSILVRDGVSAASASVQWQ